MNNIGGISMMGFRKISSSKRIMLAVLRSRASAAGKEQRYEAAALLLEECTRLRPDDADLHVQCGHMLKESGRPGDAERHYVAALALKPGDADIALQLGHLHKVLGQHDEARSRYEQASTLNPGWNVPPIELGRLEEVASTRSPMALWGTANADVPTPADLLDPRVSRTGQLVPALAPQVSLSVEHAERVEVRLGRREAGPWGMQRTLRGVEAAHGFVLSQVALTEVAVIVNGIGYRREMLLGRYQLERERDPGRIAKYVFNIWLDMSPFAPGLHSIELRFADEGGTRHFWRENAVIAPPVAEQYYPDSDFLVASPSVAPGALEASIRSRPSVVHQARRTVFPADIRSVLVMRTDQLGDLIASIPAMLRLRELVPEARLVGLMTGANADLAGTLRDLFDEIITIDFPDVDAERRRLMPLDAQRALRDQLQPYRFDIAIDLSPAGVSRELLLLSGAPFLCGFGGGDWPFLSLDMIVRTKDRWTGHDRTPHATKVRALVEGLGTMMASSAPVIRREDLSRETLRGIGIDSDRRYIVLHLGARIAFSRWPHFASLALLLLNRTDFTVVAVSDDPDMPGRSPIDLIDDARFILLNRRLAFDDFDALLSYAAVVVGNDSGPKHLAALRGTPVVTIFSARINWTEWGQENIGVVISRKVPCAGCAIHHEPENCGKGFACIVDIKPEEVFAEVIRLAQ